MGALAASLTVGLVAFAVLNNSSAVSAAPSQPYPVTGSFVQGLAQSYGDPAASPPGVNVANCRPSAVHPRPVVLLNGTYANMTDSWSGLGPTLANQGYCVYSLALGTDPHQLVQTTAPVMESTQQVATFVDQIRSQTGAAKVDLVGWSQGGLIGELYLKFFGGAAKVANFVGLSPTTQGMMAPGLIALTMLIPIPGLQAFCAACLDQMSGSALITKLNTGPIAQPGVKYTVLATLTDEVVMPSTSSFIPEPGVTNLYVQGSCLLDLSDHLALPYDPVAWKLVANALDPAHAQPVWCF